MNPTDLQQLKWSIIQAIELAPEGQSLDGIHEGARRSHRDLTVLPQVGALVAGGLVEKIPNPADTANRAVAPARRPARPAHSVRFRLTDDGRALLASARSSGEIPPLVVADKSGTTYREYDERESDDDHG